MYERLTDRARTAMRLASEEAQRLGHDYLGTEHLLLGMLREGNGVAAKVLDGMGVRLADVRAAVEAVIGRGAASIAGEMPMTPRTKRVLELAADEAKRLRHHDVGTEHLLLGIVREGEGVAATVLDGFGATAAKVRADVLRIVGPSPEPSDPA
jgi:ATP-dependent Clp protease ATP-binding subunit ClpC